MKVKIREHGQWSLATLFDITPGEFKGKSRLKWVFDINGERHAVWTNTEIYPCSCAGQFIEAVTGRIIRDGDDWRRNNINTGGAGACGRRIPYNAKIADLIRESGKKD